MPWLDPLALSALMVHNFAAIAGPDRECRYTEEFPLHPGRNQKSLQLDVPDKRNIEPVESLGMLSPKYRNYSPIQEISNSKSKSMLNV